jgi:hypothetical protein
MNFTQLIANNATNITQKTSDFYGEPLTVLKYKRKVFFDNLWNDELIECRGTVVNANGDVVQLPFAKIFNYGIESKAPTFDPNELVYVTRKVNGFMLAVSNYRGNLLVSTTGSITSPFVELGKELLAKNNYSVNDFEPGYTYLFEACHPSDPHIIHEIEGLYPLARRCLTTGVLFPVTEKKTTFQEAFDEATNAPHEGLVIYGVNSTKATKIKSRFYLMSKALARASSDKLSRLRIDEEFRELSIASRTPAFMAMTEQERLTFIRDFYA